MASLSLTVRIADRLCRSEINEMRDFYLHAGGYFDRRIKQLQQKVVRKPSNREYEDFVANESLELKEHKNLAGYFAVLMMFSAFERFLQGLYDHTIFLSAVPELRDVVLQATQGRVSLESFKLFFKRLGIDLGKPTYNWDALIRLQRYRNTVAHQGGWVTESNFKSLAPYGHKLGEKLEVDIDYVTVTGKLIDGTTDQFSKDYLEVMDRRRESPAAKPAPR